MNYIPNGKHTWMITKLFKDYPGQIWPEGFILAKVLESKVHHFKFVSFEVCTVLLVKGSKMGGVCYIFQLFPPTLHSTYIRLFQEVELFRRKNTKLRIRSQKITNTKYNELTALSLQSH